MGLIQIVLVAFIALIAVATGLLFIVNKDNARKKKMLEKIRGQGAVTQSSGFQKGQQDKRRAEIARKLKDSREGDEKSDKKKTPISQQIEQAGLSISIKKFWILSFISMFFLVFMAKIMGQAPHIILLAGVIGLLGVPRFMLKRFAAKRQKKFLSEFPDALEATVRLLKAGMPVAEAISMIAREFSGPVGEEMSRIYDQQKIGVPLHEAALLATRRMPLTEMQMFATGLSIQAQTGSSLSEVLMNLSGVIRSRFRLKRKIKALSSEAVASASIIGALPLLVATGMYFTNYEYISVLFTDPFGKILLTIAIVWMLIGILVMKVMINFKI
ncbi:MAG: type II secretion system F family protein [Alphaproteobacteria bacterium]|nr:type II secretion system F family protein [Alphaproteobacteria bacterium]